VPFPAPSSKARLGPRAETDPLERASTHAFESETQEREREEDSGLSQLRAEGDATGLTAAAPDFDGSTFEGGRALTDAEDLESHASKHNPTEQDLPLVKPPILPDDSPDSPDAPDDAAADDSGPPGVSPKPDRLAARGLRAFGFKPAMPAPPERAETSPLIPPPAPPATAPVAAAAAASPSPAPPPTATPPATAATAAAASPAPSSSSSAAPSSSASTTGSSPKVPISTAPTSLPPPTEKQSAISGPSPACPQCEAPMAWVEEHLRFYCKSCKMYF
jgi:hypothetical protein